MLAAEWLKVRTLRSMRWMLGGIGVLIPAFSVAVCGAATLEPHDTVLGASVVGGATLALVLSVSLGASIVSNEYRNGTISATFAACPRRTTALAAKLATAAGTAFAVTIMGTVLAFVIGLVMLDGTGHATGDAFPAVFGVAGLCALLAAVGTGLGAIVRHSAGAIGAGIAIVLLPAFLAPMLGPAQPWVGGVTPIGVLQKIGQSADVTPETVGNLGAGPSLAVVAVGAAGIVIAAMLMIRRRDA